MTKDARTYDGLADDFNLRQFRGGAAGDFRDPQLRELRLELLQLLQEVALRLRAQLIGLDLHRRLFFSAREGCLFFGVGGGHFWHEEGALSLLRKSTNKTMSWSSGCESVVVLLRLLS